MKKFIALLLILAAAAAFFTGCGQAPTPSPAQTAQQTTQPTGAKPDALKTGLAIISSVEKSKSATASAVGLAQADSTIVAVTVDKAGIITNCLIDQAQSKVNFNASGQLTTATNATFKTKNELGKEYGLGKVSTIGKEWDEQAKAFAKYVTGKTVADVKGIAVKDGYAANADLKATITITITDLIAGVEKAVTNAVDLGAVKGDTLGIATVTNIAKSTNATESAKGLAQVYSTYVALTRDSKGKISSCMFDGSQSNVNFDTKGVITTDLKVAPKSKNELKEAYGMKKVSTIGKEWYEQAAAFAAYVKGKTVEQVKGIALTDGKATDKDLKASVTISINDLIGLVEKASK